jgi:lysozyme
MPGARQQEFDGGVSFHWNTGAIGKASWVRAWIDRNWEKVASGLKAWNKGGGKVLPGLARRRDEEFELIRHGRYQRQAAAPAKEDKRYARIALPLSADEFASVRAALIALGYDVGDDRIRIKRTAVQAFQADHGLTVDGIAGRATLSTLQRMLDARRKAAVTAPATSGGVAAGATGMGDQLAGLPYADVVLMLAGAGAGLWLAWTYRDAVAAAVQRPLPRLASLLRSV